VAILFAIKTRTHISFVFVKQTSPCTEFATYATALLWDIWTFRGNC